MMNQTSGACLKDPERSWVVLEQPRSIFKPTPTRLIRTARAENPFNHRME